MQDINIDNTEQKQNNELEDENTSKKTTVHEYDEENNIDDNNEKMPEDQYQELKEELHDKAEREMRNVNNEIDKENKNSKDITDKYNKKKKEIKDIKKSLKLGFMEDLKRDLHNSSVQKKLMNDQLLITILQSEAQSKMQKLSHIIQDNAQNADQFDKKERIAEANGRPAPNPFVDAKYLLRMAKAYRLYVEKYQENMQEMMQNMNKKLEKEHKEFQKSVEKQQKDDQRKQKKGNKAIDKAEDEFIEIQKKRNNIIDNIEKLEQKTEAINNNYKQQKQELQQHNSESVLEDFDHNLQKDFKDIEKGQYSSQNAQINDDQEQKNNDDSHDAQEGLQDKIDANKLLKKKQTEINDATKTTTLENNNNNKQSTTKTQKQDLKIDNISTDENIKKPIINRPTKNKQNVGISL